jgi:hypothetical protein
MRGLCRLARFASQAARSGVAAGLPAGSATEVAVQQVIMQHSLQAMGELLDCCQPLYSITMPERAPPGHHWHTPCRDVSYSWHAGNHARSSMRMVAVLPQKCKWRASCAAHSLLLLHVLPQSKRGAQTPMIA